MKRILLGLAVALLTFVTSARAEGSFGPVVRWDRIEGTIVMPDGTGMTVGPLHGSARYRVGGEGKVVLYVQSGFLYARVTGLSWALHYQNGPLGSGPTGTYVWTVVCDSTGRFGSPVWADTPTIELRQGNASFAGVIALPQTCRDRPEELVLLLRHVLPGSPLDGTFVAYGAGRFID